MSQVTEPTPARSVAGSEGFEQVGQGLNVYESPDAVEGVVKWLETPEDVIAFASSGDVSDVVVVARGGTTTFLTMALNAGVKGVVTLQGAPESHLGILCREYGIPCIMSVAFDKGVRTGRGETIPADGVRIRLDVSNRPAGLVSVEVGSPVDDSPPSEDASPAMSPEQMAQIQLLLEKFTGVVPHGVEGDKVMQAEMKTRVLYADDDTMHRDLTVEEVNEAIRYYTWNEWDALASRATEGESGLIPRQEYEAMGIMQCWFRHPDWLRAIEDKIGIDKVIEIGALGRNEIGTKVNMLHLWALATAPSFGRGIALELNLHDLDYKADRIRDCLGVVRRLYKGMWGDGPILASMQDYRAEILERSWIDRFAENRISLEDPEARNTFQRFNGSAELMGFLLSFDNRLGVGDHGPYPLEDGGFVLVRDVFLNEPAYSWCDTQSGLPWSVTIAMFFPPDSGVDVQMMDLSTVFTTPANYLPHVESVAVYERSTWDTPMESVRPLGLDDMVALRTTCEGASAALYGRIAAMTQREKIEAGALTYTAGFALPIVRAAGMYDELVADHGLLEIHPAVSACYDTIVSGVATEMIPRLFLTGSWGNPVPEDVADSMGDTRDEFAVLHALKVCGFADADRVADRTELDAERIATVLAGTDEAGHTKSRSGRISGHMLTPAGKSRHVLLRGDSVEADALADVSAAYEDFLAPNRVFKQFTTDVQLNGLGGDALTGRLDAIHEDVVRVLARASESGLSWFATYERRFSEALERLRGGDSSALARPMSNSYHDVWMELHEDLLATLGRERADEDE
ncbi:PEP-utilizing enzyme [Nocardioides sp. Root151]|uniref:PEP-utilizing enzyme n=1 Tax=Nocardioides sp. Root151 TaxID=1736475 RepID=UPI00070273A5|nr:PEP-utilizing enzyme [Nocardioides sp. Root151]KQZ75686.1 hypothetical protein ASD66_04960 [Nocardioides sp. Root151]